MRKVIERERESAPNNLKTFWAASGRLSQIKDKKSIFDHLMFIQHIWLLCAAWTTHQSTTFYSIYSFSSAPLFRIWSFVCLRVNIVECEKLLHTATAVPLTCTSISIWASILYRRCRGSGDASACQNRSQFCYTVNWTKNRFREGRGMGVKAII